MMIFILSGFFSSSGLHIYFPVLGAKWDSFKRFPTLPKDDKLYQENDLMIWNHGLNT